MRSLLPDLRDAAARANVVAESIRLIHAVGGFFAAVSTTPDVRPALVVAAALAGLVRMRPGLRWRSALASAVALTLTSSVAAGVTGGLSAIAFGAVVIGTADVGIVRGGGTGALVGTVGTVIAAVLPGWVVGEAMTLRTAELWLLLATPLVGLAFGTANRDLPKTGPAALRETRAVLDDLVRLTERMPAGLDLWSVADAVLEEIRDVVGPALPLSAAPHQQAHLLLSRAGVLRGAGAPWDRRPLGLVEEMPVQRRGRPFIVVDAPMLPDAVLAELAPQPQWYVHRLGDGVATGFVLVPGNVHPSVLPVVQAALGTATHALTNVDRFERVQAVATDAARTRLAHDLHDGVAQALTHVRFELELLERAVDPELAVELERIRDAADTALLEVRRSVGELRDLQTLTDALRDHVHALQAFARTTIELEMAGEAEVPELVRREVLRVAQEAMSNALRHARASRIGVTLETDELLLQLVVEDDGVGIAPDAEPGVGLEAMERRARRVGGRLVVRERRGGGTVVDLRVPLDATPTVDDGADSVTDADG